MKSGNSNCRREGIIIVVAHKPRDTAYAKGTQLINTIGFDTIRQYWEKNGTAATVSMLSKRAPFPVTKGIVRNLVIKHNWRRRITDLNDPLFRFVLKDPGRISNFKHVQFMFRGTPFEDLLGQIHNVLRKQPRLCYCGFVCGSSPQCAGELRGFETQLHELPIAIGYLEHARPSQRVLKETATLSHDLKHQMEQGYYADDDYQGYVSNGTAILAAYLCRYPVREISDINPYARIGIAKVKQPYQRRLS